MTLTCGSAAEAIAVVPIRTVGRRSAVRKASAEIVRNFMGELRYRWPGGHRGNRFGCLGYRRAICLARRRRPIRATDMPGWRDGVARSRVTFETTNAPANMGGIADGLGRETAVELELGRGRGYDSRGDDHDFVFSGGFRDAPSRTTPTLGAGSDLARTKHLVVSSRVGQARD